MNNIAYKEIINDLTELGYNKGDILNGINDVKIKSGLMVKLLIHLLVKKQIKNG